MEMENQIKKTEERDKKEGKITRDMKIQEVVTSHPETAPVFLEHGMHCLGCQVAMFESIEQGARAHGIDVDKLMEALNRAVEEHGKKDKQEE